MRLTLIIPSLGAGGAERIMSIMGNYWATKGWKITILTFSNDLVSPFYPLDSRIQLVSLNIAQQSRTVLEGVYRNLSRLVRLRQAVCQSQPDVIISFLNRTNILTLMATRGLKIPVIISERTNPALHGIGYSWSWLRQLLYPRASALVVQSKPITANFSDKVRKKTWVIPNPVLKPTLTAQLTELQIPKPFLVAMGRLGLEKGFDLLIQAFAQLPLTCKKWSLVSIGDGPQEMELKALRDRLGLTERVFFAGLMKKPENILCQADLFVLSSRYEGFPNALCEAMACGLPVISFDCPSGPREIIRDGVDGILVSPEDVQALAGAMERLMRDETERQRMASKAVEVTQRFSLEKVMTLWENMIQEVLT